MHRGDGRQDLRQGWEEGEDGQRWEEGIEATHFIYIPVYLVNACIVDVSNIDLIINKMGGCAGT